jgi:hypothetical protein
MIKKARAVDQIEEAVTTRFGGMSPHHSGAQPLVLGILRKLERHNN